MLIAEVIVEPANGPAPEGIAQLARGKVGDRLKVLCIRLGFWSLLTFWKVELRYGKP